MTLEKRFWSKVSLGGPDECWPWTGAMNEHGYGVMRPEGRRSGATVKAHRVSAQIAGMDIEGKAVLHSCDNPGCVNPKHLRSGSQKENIADMISRRRGLVGEKNGQASLSDAQVAEIRARAGAGIRQCDLAIEYGASRSTISQIVNRKTRALVGLDTAQSDH